MSRPAAVVVGDKVEVVGAFEAKAGMRSDAESDAMDDCSN